MNRRVAIIGFATDSIDDAPLSDPDVEQWGYNASRRLEERKYHFARWYELHSFDKLYEDIPYLKNAKIPVYMQKVHDKVPRSVEFPLAQVKALTPYPYFTNSISLFIAHAILEKVDELGIYGVDMALFDGDGPSELEEQRPSVEYWIGVALGRGMKVVIPDGSDLLKQVVLYGYEQHEDSMGMRLRKRMKYLRKLRDQYSETTAYVEGCIDELLTLSRRFNVTEEDYDAVMGKALRSLKRPD